MALPWLKPLVFVASAVPFGMLVWDIVEPERMGANPIEYLTHETGAWTLRFLLIVLAMTPLQRLTSWNGWVRVRRMLGLYAFFYALLHFSVYLFLDLRLDMTEVVEDVLERPYITVGFTAFVLLWPLAITSNRAMMRRLGRNWKRLHRAVYVIAVLGVLHFLWLVKADLLEPLIYIAILAGLLLARWRRRGARRPAPS